MKAVQVSITASKGIVLGKSQLVFDVEEVWSTDAGHLFRETDEFTVYEEAVKHARDFAQAHKVDVFDHAYYWVKKEEAA